MQKQEAFGLTAASQPSQFGFAKHLSRCGYSPQLDSSAFGLLYWPAASAWLFAKPRQPLGLFEASHLAGGFAPCTPK